MLLLLVNINSAGYNVFVHCCPERIAFSLDASVIISVCFIIIYLTILFIISFVYLFIYCVVGGLAMNKVVHILLLMV